MKALLDYIPPNENEGDSLGELQFDVVNINWSNVTPDEAKRIQRQFRDLALPNGESLSVKAQNENGRYTIIAREQGEFLAQVSGSGNGFFAFRTLQGAIVGMSIVDNTLEEHS